MSETRDIVSAAITERLPIFGDPITVTRNGTPFLSVSAEIELVEDIETNVLLGRDARASNLFHILRTSITSTIDEGDIFLALGKEYLVVKRPGEENMAHPQSTYQTMQITSRD